MDYCGPRSNRYDGITYSKMKYKKRNLIERCFNSGMCGVQSWSSISSLIQSASYPLSARTSAPAGRSLSRISAIGASFI